MKKNYATFCGSVKSGSRPGITLLLRGQSKPVILTGSSFAELIATLRPFCHDGKMFTAIRQLRERLPHRQEKSMEDAV